VDRVPAICGTEASSRPSSRTSRKVRVPVPPCGSIAEWYFSAPPQDWRHWKYRTASAPWATACQLHNRIRPGGLGPLRSRQFTALGACSISIHG
jgi:hypothetical protein